MEDWLNFPDPIPAIRRHATEADAVGVRNWLWIVAGLVFLMVIVGGATRLTESGLSIVEWKPVTGVVPPLSESEWARAFDDYRQIPQYRELFPDMDLAGFKFIYFWEWAHRLLGRLIGVAFVVPFAWFWATRRLPTATRGPLLAVLALGGLQGFVGWWMVSSGLVHRTEVAQERLAIHLLLATLIFASCLWVAGGLGPQRPSSLHDAGRRLRGEAFALLGLAFLQIFVGGLVAGLRAGYVDNTWPLMDGRLIPTVSELFNLEPWPLNFVDNPVTVQFMHRMLAYAVFLVAGLHLSDALMNVEGRARRGAVIVFLHVVAQIALGIATLVLLDPPFAGTPHLLIALAHQAVGMAVVAAIVLQARRLSCAESFA
jgi:cytochrome c oxidase assembly protein subunit 15